MALVNYVDAVWFGGTVRFQIMPPVNQLEEVEVTKLLRPSPSLVLARLMTGTPIDDPTQGDIARVLSLAYNGEMWPVRQPSTPPNGDDVWRLNLRALPWYQVGAPGRPGTPGYPQRNGNLSQARLVDPPQASYLTLAVKILQAYLGGIDSSQAVWSPS